MTLEFIAEATKEAVPTSLPGLFIFQFLAVSLALYLATQYLTTLPYVKGQLNRSWVQLLAQLLVLIATGVLVFWIVPLRVLHSIQLLEEPATMVWPDIVLSSLALSRASQLWHILFKFLESKAQG